MTDRALAIIPARAGSKGLPRKNIRTIAGEPLIYWSIRAAIESQCFEEVVVTSDCGQCCELARDLGVSVVSRPKQLAKDVTPMSDVVSHALEVVKPSTFKYFTLLQPTSPLRDDRDIAAAMSKLEDSGAIGCVSVTQIDNTCLKAFVAEGELLSAVRVEFSELRRQDLPRVYKPNGAIYALRIQDFLSSQKFIGPGSIFYEMAMDNSIDIDTLSDFELAEKALRRRMGVTA